jgi:hypothetical protein
MNNQISICELIGEIESGRNFGAIRFEPNVYNKFADAAYAAHPAVKKIVNNIVECNRCSLRTAYMIFSSSWGAYQLMGFNMYIDEARHSVSIGDFLSDYSTQGYAFKDFITRKGLIDLTPQHLAVKPSARLHFAMVYNGSIVYANEIVKALRSFGFTVTT